MRSALPAFALALAACAHEPRPAAMEPAASLAAAETAFAAHSAREDMRAAFLAHFAADGVLVADGWRTAREHLEPRPAPPIVLEWRPAFVAVAASGELGLSTGPSRVTRRGDASAAPGFGQFVSVWRRAPGGRWQVLVDIGIRHPHPALWDQALQLRTAPAARGPAPDFAHAEAAFARAASGGLRGAYAAHAAADLRLYRDGAAPALGREAALAALPDEAPAALEWTIEASGVARSADLAYARGHYGAGGKRLGHFLRVWHREAAGWRILVDVTNAAG